MPCENDLQQIWMVRGVSAKVSFFCLFRVGIMNFVCSELIVITICHVGLSLLLDTLSQEHKLTASAAHAVTV